MAATEKQTFFIFLFLLFNYFFFFVVDVVVLLVVVAPLFNLILFFNPNFPQSAGLRRPSESSWARKITSGCSSAWCHSVGANTTRCHFFSLRISEWKIKWNDLVFVPLLGRRASPLLSAGEKNFNFSHGPRLVTRSLGARAGFDFHIFELMCSGELSNVLCLNRLLLLLLLRV